MIFRLLLLLTVYELSVEYSYIYCDIIRKNDGWWIDGWGIGRIWKLGHDSFIKWGGYDISGNEIFLSSSLQWNQVAVVIVSIMKIKIIKVIVIII